MLIINKKRKRLWWLLIPSLMLLVVAFIANRPLPASPTQHKLKTLTGAPQPMLNAATVNGPFTAVHWSAQPFKAGESPTAFRARLWNATDVMESVRAVRVDGSPDEKGWAADLLRECYRFVDQARPEQYDQPRQREAWDDIVRRCAGVRGVSMEERHAITEELRAAAKSSTSTLHQLQELYERERRYADNRWNNVEAQTITSALHDEDPLVRRAGINLLMEAIDVEAAGGDARREALLFAMAGSMLNQPLSDFERLERCAMLPNCELPRDDAETASSGMPDEREAARLRAAYSEAFARHMDAFSILAIR
jgi:hypothetical protein